MGVVARCSELHSMLSATTVPNMMYENAVRIYFTEGYGLGKCSRRGDCTRRSFLVGGYLRFGVAAVAVSYHHQLDFDDGWFASDWCSSMPCAVSMPL